MSLFQDVLDPEELDYVVYSEVSALPNDLTK